MDNSGTDATYGFNNGIDVNLKYNAFTNLEIRNSTITNCGAIGTAVALDNPVVIFADQGTILQLQLATRHAHGVGDDQQHDPWPTQRAPARRIREGEQHAHERDDHRERLRQCVRLPCAHQQHAQYTDRHLQLLGVGQAAVAALISGTATFLPFDNDGTDTDLANGYQPTLTACGGYPVVNTTTSEVFLTIQAGHDDPDTDNGHTLALDEWTFNERGSKTLSKSLILDGANEATTILDGTSQVGNGKGSPSTMA